MAQHRSPAVEVLGRAISRGIAVALAVGLTGLLVLAPTGEGRLLAVVLAGGIGGLAAGPFDLLARWKWGSGTAQAALVPAASFALVYVFLRLGTSESLSWRDGDPWALAALPIVPLSLARIRGAPLRLQVALMLGSLAPWLVVLGGGPATWLLVVISSMWLAGLFSYHATGLLREATGETNPNGGRVFVVRRRLLRARRSALRCAYCHDGLPPDERRCAWCGTILHEECWSLARTCPTFGCAPRSFALPLARID